MVNIMPVLNNGWNYARRIVRVTPDLILGMSGGGEATTEALSKAMLKGYREGGLFNAARSGWTTLENAVPNNVSIGRRIYNGTVNGFKSIGEGFKNFGANYHTGEMEGILNFAKKEGLTVAEATEKIAGKNKFWAGLKGGLKGFSKAMPFVGTALFALFELPNIFTAIKEKGLWQGVKETGKSVAKLGGAASGSAVGAAIGTAICPGIGTAIGGLIGWFVGEKAATAVVGKSYTEEKEEQQEQLAQAQEAIAQQQQQQVQAYQQTAQAYSNPFAYGLRDNKYANDIMAQQYLSQLG